MKNDQSPATSDEVIAKIDKALQHVHDLCQGKEKWTMRVPADVERDSDLILCEALESARKLLAASETAPKVLVSTDGCASWQEASTPSATVTTDSGLLDLLRRTRNRLNQCVSYDAEPILGELDRAIAARNGGRP